MISFIREASGAVIKDEADKLVDILQDTSLATDSVDTFIEVLTYVSSSCDEIVANSINPDPLVKNLTKRIDQCNDLLNGLPAEVLATFLNLERKTQLSNIIIENPTKETDASKKNLIDIGERCDGLIEKLTKEYACIIEILTEREMEEMNLGAKGCYKPIKSLIRAKNACDQLGRILTKQYKSTGVVNLREKLCAFRECYYTLAKHFLSVKHACDELRQKLFKLKGTQRN